VDLTKKSPKLDLDKLDQIAALPLGSHLKVDTWDDTVSQLNVKQAPLLNARDKMPFQVTPLLFRLTRYTDHLPPATSATSGGANGSPGPRETTGAIAPNAAQASSTTMATPLPRSPQ
jgi:hypothetical protein